MTEERILNLVRLVMAAVAAVCAFLLAQPDVVLEPWTKVLLGAIITALAVINPATAAAKVTR